MVVLDFSFKPDVTRQLIACTKSYTVIDHHKTAAADVSLYSADLRSQDKLVFDMAQSGAVLTFKYLFPDEKVPALLNYVQDRDLWKWELPGTKQISAWFLSTDWGKPSDVCVAVELCEHDQYMCSTIGASIGRLIDKQVEVAVRNAEETYIDGACAIAVQSAIYQSDICDALLTKYPDKDVAIVWYHSLETTKFSLRSRGEFDVSEIAKKFGGGGHKNAAGFSKLRTNPYEVLSMFIN